MSGSNGSAPKTAPPDNDPAKKSAGAKKVVGLVVSVVVVVAIFGFAIPKVASYGEAFKSLEKLDAADFVAVIGFTLLNLVSYWWVNQAAMPGHLRFGQAGVATLAPNAIASTVPAGPPIALGLQYKILNSWGYAGEKVATMVGVGGIWNVLGKFIIPVIALVALVIAGEATKSTYLIAIASVLILAFALGVLSLVLWKESLARKTGEFGGRVISAALKPFKKGPVTTLGESAVEFRKQTVSVARTRWPALTSAAVVNQISAFLILLFAFRGLGIRSEQMHWTEAFAAFAFARVISSIPITPGGAGIAELSFIGAFVAAGAPKTEAVAATLLFRALTWMAPIPFGVVAYVVWRRKKSWLKPVIPDEAPEAPGG